MMGPDTSRFSLTQTPALDLHSPLFVERAKLSAFPGAEEQQHIHLAHYST